MFFSGFFFFKKDEKRENFFFVINTKYLLFIFISSGLYTQQTMLNTEKVPPCRFLIPILPVILVIFSVPKIHILQHFLCGNLARYENQNGFVRYFYECPLIKNGVLQATRHHGPRRAPHTFFNPPTKSSHNQITKHFFFIFDTDRDEFTAISQIFCTINC